MSKRSHDDMRLRQSFPLIAVFLLAGVFALSACGKSVGGEPHAVEALPGEIKEISGDIKIASEKKTSGYYVCGLLTTKDIADATGAKVEGNERSCIQKTTAPSTNISFMLSSPEYTGQAKEIEIGGNTAYEVSGFLKECSVLVMLTDDLEEVTPTFKVNVGPIDNIDTCAFARNIATKALEKLPNA